MAKTKTKSPVEIIDEALEKVDIDELDVSYCTDLRNYIFERLQDASVEVRIIEEPTEVILEVRVEYADKVHTRAVSLPI